MKRLGLTSFERRAAHAAYETIFPGPDRGSLPLGAADMDLDAFLDDIMANIPLEPMIGLRLAFLILAFAPLFVLGRFATLMSLEVEDREHVIQRVYDSPYYLIRSTVVGLKAIGALFYCGDRRIRPLIVGSQQPAAPAHREAAAPALVPLRSKRPTHGAADEQPRSLA
jgi:hypothetical protein